MCIHLNFMVTYNQLNKKKNRLKKTKSSRTVTGLNRCPQKKGICLKITVKSPKKPSSGKRKICWVRLSNNKYISCHIPGMGGNSLAKFSNVLVKGSRVRDIPSMKYRIIRGKFDLRYVYERLTSRSKYGKKLSDV